MLNNQACPGTSLFNVIDWFRFISRDHRKRSGKEFGYQNKAV